MLRVTQHYSFWLRRKMAPLSFSSSRRRERESSQPFPVLSLLVALYVSGWLDRNNHSHVYNGYVATCMLVYSDSASLRSKSLFVEFENTSCPREIIISVQSCDSRESFTRCDCSINVVGSLKYEIENQRRPLTGFSSSIFPLGLKLHGSFPSSSLPRFFAN